MSEPDFIFRGLMGKAGRKCVLMLQINSKKKAGAAKL